MGYKYCFSSIIPKIINRIIVGVIQNNCKRGVSDRDYQQTPPKSVLDFFHTLDVCVNLPPLVRSGACYVEIMKYFFFKIMTIIDYPPPEKPRKISKFKFVKISNL